MNQKGVLDKNEKRPRTWGETERDPWGGKEETDTPLVPFLFC
jgi:hypothetical protein